MARFCLTLIVALIATCGAASADTVLITGANRGMGLEFARQYAERGYSVIATARNPGEANELNALAAKSKNVSVEKLDVTDPENVKALAAKYRGKPVDILLNNAGVLGDLPKQTFGSLDAKEFHRVMETNALGAVLVTEAFRQNIIDSTQKKIVAISSQAGLSSGPALSLLPIYGMSKAALNRGLRGEAAMMGHGVVVGLLMPLAVDTEMMRGNGFTGGIPPAAAVEKMIGLIARMTPETTRKPMDENGRALEW